jgi:hypothetical protein
MHNLIISLYLFVVFSLFATYKFVVAISFLSPNTAKFELNKCSREQTRFSAFIDFGGRDGIRTHDLLIANSGENKLRQGATIT